MEIKINPKIAKYWPPLMGDQNQFLELSDQLKEQHASDYVGQAENLIKISNLKDEINKENRKARDKKNN